MCHHFLAPYFFLPSYLCGWVRKTPVSANDCGHRLQDICCLPQQDLMMNQGHSLSEADPKQPISAKRVRLEAKGHVSVRRAEELVSIPHFVFIKTNTENSTTQTSPTITELQNSHQITPTKADCCPAFSAPQCRPHL